MSGVEISLAAAAGLAGLTGTWSPCGFSMVETIGPGGHTGGRRTTIAACVTFALGALAGGVLTFGVLAALGGLLHGATGRTAYLVAAAIAAAAALIELRGSRILPQVRRQLPEHWRRVLPMPVAAAGYGILLGLGFTTFVLTFGVWALAGISFAVGSAKIGLLLGLAFGAGRALPIVVLAPIADRPAGVRAMELMAERPGIYRGFRLGDAVALGAAAVVLASAQPATAAPAEAAKRGAIAGDATDPTAVAGDVAWQQGASGAVLRRGGRYISLPGTDPALSNTFLAVREGGTVRVLTRIGLSEVGRLAAPDADAIAITDRWLVWRSRRGRRDSIRARRLDGSGGVTGIAGARGPSQLSRPSVDGKVVAFAVNRPRRSRIVGKRIGARRGRTLASSRRELLTSPSIRGRSLLYVRTGKRRQALHVKRRRAKRRGRVLMRVRTRARRRGGRRVLWSTALAGRFAYVTVVRPGARRGRGVVRQVRRGRGRRR